MISVGTAPQSDLVPCNRMGRKLIINDQCWNSSKSDLVPCNRMGRKFIIHIATISAHVDGQRATHFTGSESSHFFTYRQFTIIHHFRNEW